MRKLRNNYSQCPLVLMAALTFACEQPAASDGTRISSNESLLETTAAGSPADEPPDDTPVSSAQQAFNDDAQLMADELGFSLEEAKAHMRFSDRFQKVAEKTLARFPDQVAALWIDSAPATRGHIVFVDEVPPELDNDPEIELKGGALHSMDAQYKRASQTAHALRGLGYQTVETYYDHKTQLISAGVALDTKKQLPDAAVLAAEVSARLANAQGLKQAAKKAMPQEFAVVEIPGPVEPTHVYGGSALLGSGSLQCTTGWTVDDGNKTGIVTARHCGEISSPVDEYARPFTSSLYDIALESKADYSFGDIAWYDVTEHGGEEDEFYPEVTMTRTTVTGTRSTSTMVGSIICFFGAKSLTRHCNYSVQATGVSVTETAPINGLVQNLVRTSNPNEGSAPIQGGDSGGGWGSGSIAWGVQNAVTTYSSCGGTGQPSCKAYFTPIQNVIDLFGVTLIF